MKIPRHKDIVKACADAGHPVTEYAVRAWSCGRNAIPLWAVIVVADLYPVPGRDKGRAERAMDIGTVALAFEERRLDYLTRTGAIE